MAVLRVPALRPIIMPRRLTEPRPERAYYERVNARIDRLEDTNTHFYNVIDELRERVSTLEKKLERLRQ
jgi:predicted nuclease with TOPRIM domain